MKLKKFESFSLILNDNEINEHLEHISELLGEEVEVQDVVDLDDEILYNIGINFDLGGYESKIHYNDIKITDASDYFTTTSYNKKDVKDYLDDAKLLLRIEKENLKKHESKLKLLEKLNEEIAQFKTLMEEYDNFKELRIGSDESGILLEVWSNKK